LIGTNSIAYTEMAEGDGEVAVDEDQEEEEGEGEDIATTEIEEDILQNTPLE